MKVLLANPRGFCAGVDRAIEIVERALRTARRPDLRRHEVVHNKFVVEDLRQKGAVFVDALAAINEILQSNPRVLKDPPPVIAVSVLADCSINIAVKPWLSVADYGPAPGEINKAIVETFRARAIIIPFPQREVRMLA